MAELDVTCPDCGTTYQATSEQAGKLLHCKCGRFLVAGSVNQKSAEASPATPPPTPKAAPPAPPAETASPKIGVKPPAVVIPPPEVLTINVKTPVHAAPPPPPEPEPEPEVKAAPRLAIALEPKHWMMIGGGVAVVAILAFVMMRPSSSPATPTAAETPATATDPGAVAVTGSCANPARLENGTVVARSPLGTGAGKLEIDNQSPTDVSVRLIGGGDLTVSWVYVQQGQTVRLDNIPLGTHRLLYSAGSDWDATSLGFRCNTSYAQFDKQLEYLDRRVDDRTIYSNYKVTIGKTKAAAISKEEFLKGFIARSS